MGGGREECLWELSAVSQKTQHCCGGADPQREGLSLALGAPSDG